MAELPLLLLILLLLAILLRLDLVYYLVYVLSGVYLVARWWSARGSSSLLVEREFTDHIFAGETTTVRVCVTNRGRLPIPWLRYDETAGPALGSAGVHVALPLAGRQTVRLEYPLDARRRGVYDVGPGQVTTGDLFGFVEAHGRSASPKRLVVYPRVIPLVNADLTSRLPHGTIASRTPIFADPARVVGIRGYIPGDPVRSIDWKSSARSGTLQVKKVSPAVSVTTMIFLEMRTGSYTRQLQGTTSEWAVVLAASLAAHLHGRRQAVGLASNGADAIEGVSPWLIPPRSGTPHLMKLLEWLARVQLAETGPLAEWLPSAVVSLPWGTTVVVVAPTGAEPLLSSLGRLRMAGLNPVLLATEPHAQFGLVHDRARRLGVRAHLVADEQNLRRWQAGSATGFVRGGGAA